MSDVDPPEAAIPIPNLIIPNYLGGGSTGEDPLAVAIQSLRYQLEDPGPQAELEAATQGLIRDLEYIARQTEQNRKAVAELKARKSTRRSKRPPRHPPTHYVQAYWLDCVMLGTQAQKAAILSHELKMKRSISQPRFSAMVKRVEKFLKAGGVLPEPPAVRQQKTRTMDAAVIDRGRRRDGLAKRQRERFED